MIAFAATIRQIDQLPGQGRMLFLLATDCAAVHIYLTGRFGISVISVRPLAAAQ